MDISGCARSYPQNAHSHKNSGRAQCSPRAMNPVMNPSSNPAGHPANNPGNPNGCSPRAAQGANQPGAQNTGVQNTRTHSLPALLIPEDYRARAVALHARELILRKRCECRGRWATPRIPAPPRDSRKRRGRGNLRHRRRMPGECSGERLGEHECRSNGRRRN